MCVSTLARSPEEQLKPYLLYVLLLRQQSVLKLQSMIRERVSRAGGMLVGMVQDDLGGNTIPILLGSNCNLLQTAVRSHTLVPGCSCCRRKQVDMHDNFS